MVGQHQLGDINDPIPSYSTYVKITVPKYDTHSKVRYDAIPL